MNDFLCDEDMSFYFRHQKAKGINVDELDVSNFDTSKVLDFSYMFSNYNGHIIGKYKFPKEVFE